MAHRGLHLSIFVALVLSLSCAAAITPIAPANGEQTLNQQPLFSWTDYAGNLQDYTLILSQEQDLSPTWKTFVTTTPYHQLQETLTPGTWYWQVTARGGTTETTPIQTLTVLERPTFSITPDLSRYKDSYRVDFLINAPLGSHVSVNITKQGFLLPFTTSDLQTATFTSFLEPGSYVITAAFSFEGARSSYADVLTLTEPTPGTYVLSFNITDSDSNPLEGVSVELTGEDHDYDAETDEDGLVNITVEEDYYTFLITQSGFFDDEFEKRITGDKSFRIRLVPETAATATATPALASVAVLPSPDVAITAPAYKESITEPPLDVTFTLSEHDALSSCDLLYRSEEQQGWTLAGTTDELAAENTISYDDPKNGEALIKVQCKLKNHEHTTTSETRTVIIALTPDYHEGIQAFLDDVQEAGKSIPSSNDPLFLSLDVQGSIAAAKKQVNELNDRYIALLKDGQEAQAEELSDTIDQELATLEEEIITTFSVVDRDETVTEIDLDASKDLIDVWLGTAELTDKERQAIRADMLEEQTSYTVRTRTTVARIDTLAGNQRYVTGVTRTLQNYYGPDEQAETIIVTEELPSYFLQQTGAPKVLDGTGEELAAIINERATMTLPPEGSYTLLFSGNVKQSTDQLNAILIRRHDNATDYLKDIDTGALAGITGAVTNVLGGVTGLSPLIWVFIAIVIATFIVNPFTAFSGGKKDKHVARLTDAIHDTLDLMEQGMPEQAFQNYHSIIEMYERLKPEHQASLGFAITNLSSALHVYTMNQTIEQTLTRLTGLTSRAELAQVQAMTMQIINDYKELDADSRTQLKPSLQALQALLKEKHAFLTSPKPRKDYPLP